MKGSNGEAASTNLPTTRPRLPERPPPAVLRGPELERERRLVPVWEREVEQTRQAAQKQGRVHPTNRCLRQVRLRPVLPTSHWPWTRSRGPHPKSLRS